MSVILRSLSNIIANMSDIFAKMSDISMDFPVGIPNDAPYFLRKARTRSTPNKISTMPVQGRMSLLRLEPD